MATNIGAIVVQLKGDTMNFNKKFMAAEQTLNRFNKKALAVGTSLTGIGKKMTMAFTVPILAGLGLSVKAFADFDKAMTESLAIMGNVSSEMRMEMEKTAKTLSEKSTFSAKKLAEAYFFLASAGLDAKQSVAALPAVTAFAQAGVFDLSTATSLLTDAQSALGLKSKDAAVNLKNMTRVSDLLVKANTLADASVLQFAEALTTQAAAAMRNFGIEVEDGIAVLTAYAEQGIKGQKAGSTFSRMLRLMTMSAVNNKKAFKALGIDVVDSQDKMRRMADISKDLTLALQGMGVTERAAALETLGFKARIQQAIFPILGMNKELAHFRQELKGAGGITQEVAETQMEAFSNQMTAIKHKIENAAAALGATLIPMIRKVANQIAEWTDKFNSLDASQKEMIAKTLLWVAAAGPLLLLLGKIIASATVASGAIFNLGKAAAFLLTTPTGLIVVGAALIAGIVVEMIRWRNAAKEVEETLQDVANMQRDIHKNFGMSLSDLRAINDARTGEGVAALEAMNSILESTLTLEEKIAKLEPLANIKAADIGATEVAKINEELTKLEEMAGDIAASANRPSHAFVQSEDDLKAKAAFEDARFKSILDQVSAEKKINLLIAERKKIQDEIGKAQKGSEAFFKLREEALDVENEIKATIDDKAQKIKEDAEKAKDASSRFAGAAEVGSVEAYRLRIRSDRGNMVEKNTKKMNKQLDELKRIGMEHLTILRKGLGEVGEEIVVDLP